MATVTFHDYPFMDLDGIAPGQVKVYRFSENETFTWDDKVVSVSVFPFIGIIGASVSLSMEVDKVNYNFVGGSNERFIRVFLRNTSDRIVFNYTVFLGIIRA